MRETFEQLSMHLWMVLHHRWIALSGAIVICAIGWTGLQLVPNTYEVDTKVYVDTQTVLKPLLKGLAVNNTVLEQAAIIMRKTLLSRPNLEKVLRDTDLDLTVHTPKQRDLLMKKLAKHIKVSSVALQGHSYSRNSENNLYNISYTNSDPKLAKRVVESLLNIFVESVLGTSRRDTTSATQFLDQQIADYAKKLDEADTKLKDFKQRHIGMMPDDGKNYFTRMTQLQAQLQEATLNLQEADNKSKELRRQIQNLIASSKSNSQDSGLVQTPLQKRIQAMQEKLDNLRLQYTDQHPDVIAAKAALKELKRQEAKEQAKAKANPNAPDNDILNSKAYGDLKLLLGESESNAAALQTRVAAYQKRIDDMRPLINTIPEVEAQLAKLTRNYGIVKQTYDDLVKRRESAQLSTSAESTADNSQFRIVEPPVVPTLPTAPNRFLLASVILIAGFAGGAGLAWLYAQTKPAFYTRNQLSDYSELPVLGSVPMKWTAGERAKRKFGVMVYGTVVTALVCAYVALMVHNGLDITPVIEQLKTLRAKIV